MRLSPRSYVLTAITGILLLARLSMPAQAQEPPTTQPSPTPDTLRGTEQPDAPPVQGGSAGGTAPPAQQPATKSTREIDPREELTGDWGGARTKLKERGITLEGSWTQFYQAVVGGGLQRGGEYGGKITLRASFDTGRLKFWPNGTFNLLVATRYGDSAAPLTGSILTVNSGLVNPAASGTVTALIALYYTHLFPLGKPGDLISVSLGKYDTLDLVPEPFLGGEGITKFMNIAWNARPQNGLNVPPVTIGTRLAWVKGGEPFVTFNILDPQSSQTTSGLEHPFSKGVTLVPGITFPARFKGRPGHQGFGATWSSQKLVPFQQIPLLILPPQGGSAEPQRGSWSFTYSADQYLAEKWGMFWQVGVADASNNALARYFTIGIAGTSPFKGRERDAFGIAYAYTGVSSDLKDVTEPLVRLRDEQGFEIFYRYAITPWLRLTGDFQMVHPTRPRADTAIVPGLRLQIIF
jgi:porin